MNNEAVMLTGEGIAFARLASLKMRLKLEKLGMTGSRGVRMRPILAKELGLKPRDSHDKYIAALESRMAVLMAKRAADIALEKV